jgi:hypothetical protein
MQLPPLQAFASHVDDLFKPRIYNRYKNSGRWRHQGSSDSSSWDSHRYSTNEQNTFHLFPNMWNSVSRRYEPIGEPRSSIQLSNNQ